MSDDYEQQKPQMRQSGDDDDSAIEGADDVHIHGLSEAWAELYGGSDVYRPGKRTAELLEATARQPKRPYPEPRAAELGDADLAAIHLAVITQPDALDRQAFEAYYIGRTSNMKAAASFLNVGRQHFHRLLREFRRRVYRASRQILADETALRHVADMTAPKGTDHE